MRNDWRSGMKDVEMLFIDHLNKSADMFGTKANEFEKIRMQLVNNHEYLISWYKRMLADLEAKKALIVAER